MVNVKEFIMNASLLIAIVSVSGLLYKQFLVNASPHLKNTLLLALAIFSGWISMFFGIHLDSGVIFDLRFVPVLVVALFAKNAFFIFVAGFGIGLARLTFGISEAAIAGLCNMIVLSAAGMVLQLFFPRLTRMKRILLSVFTVNFINVLFVAFFGVISFVDYLSLIMPIVLPMNILLSFLIVWMINDLYHEYVSKRNLIESARKDPLTKLYNRRAFMNYFQKFSSGERGDEPFVLAFIDIDYFKQVNDTYGHIVGDLVLQTVSARLLHNLRSIDIVARYGGEEFVVILPDCTKENAIEAIERIRETVAAQPVCVNNIEIPITFSAGLAASNEFTAEQLLKRADDALYEAKQSGRNKVIYATAEAACS